jgi:uncharacterized protein with HEPN domain
VRADDDRLRDILDAITAIERKTGRDRAAFDADEMLRVWCLHHLIIIGEAVAGLSQPLRDRYPSAPWRGMKASRNALVHGYFAVKGDEVWVVVERDLGPLRAAVEQILAAEGSPS